MIIECPQCTARFNVPDQAIGAAGRTVKCAKCAHQWHVMLPQAAPRLAPEITIAEGSIPRTPVIEKPRTPRAAPAPKPRVEARSGLSLTGLYALALASVLVAIMVTVFGQFPSLFGYADSRSFSLVSLSLDKKDTEDGTIYAVRGHIVNNAEAPKQLPTLRVTLVNAEGDPLRSWDFSESNRIIAPHDAFTFNAGPISSHLKTGNRFVVEIGNSLELRLRRKPS